MDNSVVLSICIPTYNRAECLKQCLTSIVTQFADPSVGEKVEIIISDNGSQDNTQNLIFEYQSHWPQIRYFRNPVNLGIDRNILNVVENARGRFCWLLGDDDSLFKDALGYLLPLLEKETAHYFLANCWGYDRELKEQAVSWPNLRISQDESYLKLSDFVKRIPDYRNMVGYFGGLSCQIFRRSDWVALPDKKSFIGSQALHLYVILKAFKNLPAFVIAKPLVKTRADNMRWENFPGLETITKRARATRESMVWILKLYEIPYSKTKLIFKYYGGIIYFWLVYLAKKTVFRSQKSRNLVKKVFKK
jgi:abequosyltransferase